MASFSNLPLELFQQTVNHLPQKDPSIVSRTSKNIRAAAECLLYREIAWEWQKDASTQPPVYLLLRTILSRPNLAAYVEKLSLRGKKPRKLWVKCKWRRRFEIAAGPSIPMWEAGDEPPFTVTEMAALRQVVSLQDRLWEKDWLRQIVRGGVDVFIALLISRLSSLRSLLLDSDLARDTSFLRTVFENSMLSGTYSSFPFLKHITYSGDTTSNADVTYHTLDLSLVLPLFYIESLASLTLSLPPGKSSGRARRFLHQHSHH